MNIYSPHCPRHIVTALAPNHYNMINVTQGNLEQLAVERTLKRTQERTLERTQRTLKRTQERTRERTIEKHWREHSENTYGAFLLLQGANFPKTAGALENGMKNGSGSSGPGLPRLPVSWIGHTNRAAEVVPSCHPGWENME